ncbi:protein Star-like [Tigriopus californicus]|uniref:protein Star-like n=1 Tax=Tigriopus californicus TaxID=6832 RepID=UPI0027DA3417|nr:protein Star-like [Tigriopus californicus]
MKVSYGSYFNLGRIVDESPGRKDKKVVDVMCLPLFAILKALKVPQVDYFSLDVEGNELDVLKTIPWDEVNILALSVEFSHIGESHTTGSKSELESFMESKGYRVASKVTNGHQLANDFIFAKKGVFDNISIADVIS